MLGYAYGGDDKNQEENFRFPKEGTIADLVLKGETVGITMSDDESRC